jgi:translation initiation factor IF-2
MNTNQKQTISRPPIIAFMGHIDHGKTSLLDRIRQSHLQNKEVGGITQHISAYQVEVNGQKITFIDTPGHKVFDKMRARGAKITDLVVLVIAADEGIKPQTVESLGHIRQAKTPFLIALNKMDLPGANPEEIKNKLTQFGVVTEDRGGDVVMVPVSAKTGQGIDELLEMIILSCQMQELTAPISAPFQGMVIESRLDSRRGNLVTIIVKEGHLSVGQEIISEVGKTKVRALFDDLGQSLKTASISQPVAILGFVDLPPVGSLVVDPQVKIKIDEASKDLKETGADGLLKLVVKADTQGTLEALIGSLPQEGVTVLRKGVGDINESDVFFASSTGAQIIGFNIRLSNLVAKLAETEKVNIQTEKIIYELIQSIEERLGALKKVEEEDRIKGEAEIIAEFAIPQGRVAGAKVRMGLIKSGAEVIIFDRKGNEKKTKIVSLQKGKEKIDQADKDHEFGAIFSPVVDFHIGDVIKSYQD